MEKEIRKLQNHFNAGKKKEKKQGKKYYNFYLNVMRNKNAED